METKTTPNPDHDFNTPIEKTATSLAKMIIAKLDDAKDVMIVESYEKLDPATKSAFIEKSTDISIEIMGEIANSDIPADYATTCIDKIIVVLESLKQFVAGTINQRTDELMARTIGVKSPMTGTYSQQCATVGTILTKLDEVRNLQGNIREDYFGAKPEPKEELSTGTTEVAVEKSE